MSENKYPVIALIGTLLLVSLGVYLAFQSITIELWISVIFFGLSFSGIIKVIQLYNENKQITLTTKGNSNGN